MAATRPNRYTGDPALGRRVAAAREEREWTPVELARRLTKASDDGRVFSRGWVDGVEMGRRWPRGPELHLLCRVLKISIQKLMTGDEPSYEDWLRLEPLWEQIERIDQLFLQERFEAQLTHRVAEVAARRAALNPVGADVDRAPDPLPLPTQLPAASTGLTAEDERVMREAEGELAREAEQDREGKQPPAPRQAPRRRRVGEDAT